MLLQYYHIILQRILPREGAIFVKILDIFEFFVSWWPEVAWFRQFLILQIIMTSFWWR